MKRCAIKLCAVSVESGRGRDVEDISNKLCEEFLCPNAVIVLNSDIISLYDIISIKVKENLVFSGSLTRLLRYATSLDARRTTVRLCSIKAASLAMRAKSRAKKGKLVR